MSAEWIIEKLLPSGGGLVSIIECYFDESGTHDKSPVMCMAGYIIDRDQALLLTEEWEEALKGLPYFHMVDCAHGNGVFADLSKEDRIEMQTNLIGIIKRRVLKGIAVSMTEMDFQETMSDQTVIGTSYSFCANSMLAGVQNWLSGSPEVEKTAFFFEAGHDSQHEANRIMSAIFLNENKRASYKYGSHTFADKKDSPTLQAADLLAWQVYTDRRHVIEGRPRRKDYESLLGAPHQIVHLDKPYLEGIASAFRAIPGFSDHTKVA